MLPNKTGSTVMHLHRNCCIAAGTPNCSSVFWSVRQKVSRSQHSHVVKLILNVLLYFESHRNRPRKHDSAWILKFVGVTDVNGRFNPLKCLKL